MSGLKRFFVDKIEENESTVKVTGDEYNHAVNTLRLRSGDEIILLDNSGKEYISTVTEIDKKSFTAKINKVEIGQTEASSDVMLITGYLKGDKTELVVQKAVELGVKKIVVFNSKYCSAYYSENKGTRLQRVSMEASKQCGRSIYPEIIYAESFEKAVECGKCYENKLFCCEFVTDNSESLDNLSGSTAIIVGSEGGFSPEEAEFAFKSGYETVTLGKRILRAETASIVTLAIVMHLLGELK